MTAKEYLYIFRPGANIHLSWCSHIPRWQQPCGFRNTIPILNALHILANHQDAESHWIFKAVSGVQSRFKIAISFTPEKNFLKNIPMSSYTYVRTCKREFQDGLKLIRRRRAAQLTRWLIIYYYVFPSSCTHVHAPTARPNEKSPSSFTHLCVLLPVPKVRPLVHDGGIMR